MMSYSNDEELTGLKLWIGGGALGLGGHSICLAHGTRLSVDSDNSMNESFSIDEDDGELQLKPWGISMFGQGRDTRLSPSEARGRRLYMEDCLRHYFAYASPHIIILRKFTA